MISEQRMVDRTRLLKRVRNSVSRIVALIAPAGFGKTCTAREIVATIGGPSVEWDAALAAPSELVNELRTAWMNAPPDATLLLDSLELASVDPAFQAVLAEIIRNRGERTIIIAARPPFPLLNTRILPPGGYVRFGPDDLRFTIEEVRAALGVAFDDEQIERVVSATGGWPFGVFAVGERAAGGDLDAVLDALREGKLTDVSDYVCNEIIAGLPNDLRRLLVAVAAVGMCGSAALGHSLAHPDLSNALALLSATLPITRDDEGGILLHPLVAAVVERRFAEEIEEQRLVFLERALRGEHRTPLSAATRLAARLSPRALRRFPDLWRPMIALRARTLPPSKIFAEVKRIRESIPPGADTVPLRGLDGYLAFHAVLEDDLEYAGSVLSRYAGALPTDASNGDEAMLLAAQGRLHAAHYQTQEALAYYERAVPYLDNPAVAASITANAAFLRLVGADWEAATTTLKRALETARRFDQRSSALEVLMHAIFFAWFMGDEIEYHRSLASFEEELAGSSHEPCASFLEAVRSRSIDPLGGKLTPRWRAYAALIVAGDQAEVPEMERTLQTALGEASASGDVFAEFLVRLASSLAIPGRRAELQGRLAALAVDIPEPALRASLESFSSGQDGAPLLAPFIRRFLGTSSRAVSRPRTAPLRVNVLAGTVSRGDRTIKLSNRPLALVLTLAAFGSLSRERLCEMLWPAADDVSAANTLKMCVRRARRQLDDPSAIVYEKGLWSLREDILVDIVEIERNLRAIPPSGILSPTNRSYLELLFEFLSKTQSAEIYAAEGMEMVGMRVNAVRHHVVTRLGENALANNDLAAALEYAATLRRWDPTDEASYILSIRAYALSGNAAEAYREYRQYAAQCERELGIRPELSLEELLKAPAPN
jgi:DNA-binding SARP family transcriptional activator